RRVDCLGKKKGIDRRNLGWLEYDGTPCGQGSSDLERDLAEREIPWRYGCDNASGLSDDQRVPHPALEREITGQSRTGVPMDQRAGDLDSCRHLERHPDFRCYC